MFDEEKQSKYILNKEKCCAGGETEVCRHSFRINLNSSSLLRLTSSVLMVSCTLHCLGGKYLEIMLTNLKEKIREGLMGVGDIQPLLC